MNFSKHFGTALVAVLIIFAKPLHAQFQYDGGRLAVQTKESAGSIDALARAKAAHELRDYIKERELIEPLAKAGNAQAEYMLAFLYRFGLGVPPNITESSKWCLRAALQKDPWAEQCFGESLLRGEGVDKDVNQAIIWLKKSADRGFSGAYLSLGEVYFGGEGVQQNSEMGIFYYSKAVELGDPTAAFYLGSAYEQGLHVKRDLPRAAYWYHKGAELGFHMCQYNLGRLYAGGLGVPQDLVEAYKWAILATYSGASDSAVLRDFLKPKMTLDQIAKGDELARVWMANHQTLRWKKL